MSPMNSLKRQLSVVLPKQKRLATQMKKDNDFAAFDASDVLNLVRIIGVRAVYSLYTPCEPEIAHIKDMP